MNTAHCETVRDRIPDFVRGCLHEADTALVRAHLEECADCRMEAALVGRLYEARPVEPEGLARRIEEAVRRGRRSLWSPWWGLAAASVAALALGIGVISREAPVEEGGEVPAYVASAEEVSLWPGDDGLIAGVPTLDDLSDEALQTLLDELERNPSGGAA
jgi:predicted anti-sigma-YlaC factor YlaD